jgi:catechol 2,3-dioxygenase-like lactoylglutathione lyase family enzyme
MRLQCSIIFAKDIERMTAFYRDGLGLRVLPERAQAGWVELDAGGATIALHAIPDHIAKDIVIASPPEAREDTPIKLVFETADVEAARAHLVAHGAVMGEPRSWGACDGLDPEGNVFQIAKRDE